MEDGQQVNEGRESEDSDDEKRQIDKIWKDLLADIDSTGDLAAKGPDAFVSTVVQMIDLTEGMPPPSDGHNSHAEHALPQEVEDLLEIIMKDQQAPLDSVAAAGGVGNQRQDVACRKRAAAADVTREMSPEIDVVGGVPPPVLLPMPTQPVSKRLRRSSPKSVSLSHGDLMIIIQNMDTSKPDKYTLLWSGLLGEECIATFVRSAELKDHQRFMQMLNNGVRRKPSVDIQKLAMDTLIAIRLKDEPTVFQPAVLWQVHPPQARLLNKGHNVDIGAGQALLDDRSVRLFPNTYSLFEPGVLPIFATLPRSLWSTLDPAQWGSREFTCAFEVPDNLGFRPMTLLDEADA